MADFSSTAAPENLLANAQREREAGRFEEARRWLDLAIAAADRPSVYPSVKGAIEVEGLRLMLARGDLADARAALPSLIERQRRRPMTEFPIELIEIEMVLDARSAGVSALRVTFARWERRIRRDWGAGTGAHDSIVRTGIRVLLEHGTRDEARDELKSVISRLEKHALPVSPAVRALETELG